jgi:hypothetical protein
MMDELREIRDQTSALISTMSTEEVVRFFPEKAQEAAEQNGMVLVPHPTFPHAKMLVSKPLS